MLLFVLISAQIIGKINIFSTIHKLNEHHIFRRILNLSKFDVLFRTCTSDLAMTGTPDRDSSTLIFHFFPINFILIL